MDTPYSVLSAVLAVIIDHFEACDRTPAKSFVSVGGAIVDDCCTGTLIVTAERIYRTTSPFPTEAVADDTCNTHVVAINVLATIARCMPTIDSKGNAPKPAAQEAAAAAAYIDSAILWRALNSANMLADDEWERASVNVTFGAEQGACITIEGRMTLGINQSGWCLECPPAAPEPPPEDE